MKTYKRAQSTLNNEARPLIKHPENIIYKTKTEVDYMWQYPNDTAIYYTSIYYGKNGNIIGMLTADEHGDPIRMLELK